MTDTQQEQMIRELRGIRICAVILAATGVIAFLVDFLNIRL